MSVETRESLIRSAEITDVGHTRLVSVGDVGQSYDKEPTFLTAIAQELANLHGGTVQQHARAARRMLEAAFRSLERKERAARQSRAVHAA